MYSLRLCDGFRGCFLIITELPISVIEEKESQDAGLILIIKILRMVVAAS